MDLTAKRRKGSFNKLYYIYQRSAKVCGRRFYLSKDQFEKLIFKHCHYCASEPSQIFKQGRITILYNGIDRKDNSKDYTPRNSVTCCWVCNKMKNGMSVKKFLAQAIKICINLAKKA